MVEVGKVMETKDEVSLTMETDTVAESLFLTKERVRVPSGKEEKCKVAAALPNRVEMREVTAIPFTERVYPLETKRRSAAKLMREMLGLVN